MTNFCLALALLLLPCVTLRAAEPVYNVTEIPGPFEVTVGAPQYVSIKKLTVRQLGQYVQFVWEAGANPKNQDSQYYFIFFDTDLNPRTGQSWGGVGGELKIALDNPSGAALIYFNADGKVVNQIDHVPVFFQENSFFLTIEKSRIPADHFKLYFESSGATPYVCRGAVKEITLQPEQDDIAVVVTADQMVLTERPPLVSLPTKAATAQLRTYLVRAGGSTLVPPEQVVYSVAHPVTHRPDLGDPSSIISVDANGVARYLKEGYVFVRANLPGYGLGSDRIILATGQVYGDSQTDNVIAVFPPDYREEGGVYSFADMMRLRPNYMRTVNLAYRVTSSLYGGFMPYAGDRQIFALLVLSGLAGGNNNPLETSPVGYMNFGDGTPQYDVVIHEMGHNFSLDAPGMSQLLSASDRRIGSNGFAEGVASLPVIYLFSEIATNPEQFGISRDSYEWDHCRRFLSRDTGSARSVLQKFEALVASGASKGVFDNGGKFDGVATFCSFFQSYSYGFTPDQNPYGNEMIRRFLVLFGERELAEFDPARVETYFCAAFSVAAGADVRQKLRSWGFTIDDAYYDRLRSELAARETGGGISPIIAPVVREQAQSQAVASGTDILLSVTVTGAPIPAYQWQKNGTGITGATRATYSIKAAQPSDAGCYAVALSNGATVVSSPAIIGVSATSAVVGQGEVVGTDVRHPNGKTFDQVLLTGAAEAITASRGKVTRTSFIDLNDDIVQVEFSGAGTLSLVLDSPSGPARPANYTQNANYMKGHAGIVIVGADSTTNVSVFTIGRATAFDPTGRYNILLAADDTNVPARNGSSLFVGHETTAYDGVADLAFIAIQSTDGKFGGIRTANARYFATHGLTGVYAPDVAFQGPVFIADIDARDSATPVIEVGSVSDARITGGDLRQSNGAPVQVRGLTRLQFAPGSDSGGHFIDATRNRAVLMQDGEDVTARIVVNPGS